MRCSLTRRTNPSGNPCRGFPLESGQCTSLSGTFNPVPSFSLLLYPLSRLIPLTHPHLIFLSHSSKRLLRLLALFLMLSLSLLRVCQSFVQEINDTYLHPPLQYEERLAILHTFFIEVMGQRTHTHGRLVGGSQKHIQEYVSLSVPYLS